jgi:hypothetical protein
MATDERAASAPPEPDPALRKLDRLVGTWELRGRTLGSDEEDVSGRTSFEWLPGGFFLQQRVELDFAGYAVQGLEIIGYDPATGRFPSTVYANMVGTPIPYEHELEGDRWTIRTELAGGATYRGTFSRDGNSGSGGWRPNEGAEGPGNVAYDVTATRVG